MGGTQGSEDQVRGDTEGSGTQPRLASKLTSQGAWKQDCDGNHNSTMFSSFSPFCVYRDLIFMVWIDCNLFHNFRVSKHLPYF